MVRATEALLDDLRGRLRDGRARAIPGAQLAQDMNVNERTIRALVEELRRRSVLVGSTPSGEQPGYFRIVSPEDLEEGTRHLRARALSILTIFHAVRRAAEAKFSHPEVLRLFELEEVGT